MKIQGLSVDHGPHSKTATVYGSARTVAHLVSAKGPIILDQVRFDSGGDERDEDDRLVTQLIP